MSAALPRILIIDDVFGRRLVDRRNEERASLCGKFLFRDVTGDEAVYDSKMLIRNPRAEAVFFRGQSPLCSGRSDVVENDLEGCLSAVEEGWSDLRSQGPPWSLVLLDLCFFTGKVTADSDRKMTGMPEGRPDDDHPDGYFGLRVLEALHRRFPDLPVVIFSSNPRAEVSRRFTEGGALGFLSREGLKSPRELDDYLFRHGLIPDISGRIVGHSRSLLLALRSARRVADLHGNVLLRGERGTGKESLAHYLHEASREKTKDRPFVIVNSAVFSPDLYASELFGIDPKIATGVAGKSGLVEQANGGDLFFDEVKDMPTQMQAGVLRVLQERKIRRVGGARDINVNVRFLSATNAELESIEFRKDLFDRLREGGTILLPPLRHRPEDIPLLVNRFLLEAEAHNPDALSREISDEAIERLRIHPWPGNIRELRSVIFNAVAEHPDVEYLVAGHLQIDDGNTPVSRVPVKIHREAKADGERRDRNTEGRHFENALRSIEAIEFPESEISFWAGSLAKLEGVHFKLICRYLEACLEATRKRTPDHPEGELRIHPAAKLMTGNRDLTASKAADLIKRLLKPHSNDLSGILADAYATAVRLRPRGPGSLSADSNAGGRKLRGQPPGPDPQSGQTP